MLKRSIEPSVSRDPIPEARRRVAARGRRDGEDGIEDGAVEDVADPPAGSEEELGGIVVEDSSSDRERLLVWAVGATAVGGAALAAAGSDPWPSAKAGPVSPPPDPTPQPKPGPTPELKPEPKPGPKPEPKPEPEPEPKPNPKPDPNPDPKEAPLKAPRLTLVEDTGTAGDGITRLADIDVDTRELRPGAMAEVSLDGGQTWTAVQDRIAASVFDDRPDGHQRVLARQRAPDGAISAEQQLEFVLDRTAPAIPQVVFQPTTLRDRGTQLREPGYVVLQPSEPGTLKWSSSQDGVATEHDHRHGAVRLPEGLPASAGQISAAMVDEAGNESPWTRLHVELTPPNAPGLVAELPAHIDAPTTDVVMHRGERLKVKALEPDARWQFSIDGRPWLPGQGDAITHELLWEKGMHAVRVMQFDAHGNESDITSRTVEVADTLRVKLRHDTGRTEAQLSDRLTYDATLDVSGLDPLAHARWEYQINGGAWVPGAASNELANALFKDEGAVAVQVRAFNSAGVVNAEAKLDFEIDRTPPKLSDYRLSRGDTGKLIEGKKVNYKGTDYDPNDKNASFIVVNAGTLALKSLEPEATWDVGVYRDGEVSKSGTTLGGMGGGPVPYEWHRGLTDAALPSELLKPGPNVFNYVVFDRAGNTEGNRDGMASAGGVILLEFLYFIPPVSAASVPPL